MWPIALGLGLLGAYNANKQANAARHQQQSALDFQKQQYNDAYNLFQPVQSEMNAQALGYNPYQETQNALGIAGKTTEKAISNALLANQARYRMGGGTPGNSSIENIQNALAIQRASDPLTQFALERSGSDFGRKLQALAAARSAAPGNLGSQYAEMANNNATNNFNQAQGSMGGSLQLLEQALTELTQKKKTSGQSNVNLGKNFAWTRLLG